MTASQHRPYLPDPAMRCLLFATSNPHKVSEVQAILKGHGWKIVTLDNTTARALAEPIEDGDSFAENAAIKARYYAQATGQLCLAEDSGLEVDALNGAPGVHSARYADASGSRAERDTANNAKLLASIAPFSETERGARFVCALCVASEAGIIIATARGEYEGQITSHPAGNNGFGYDPLLFLPDVGLTSAQLSPQQKNERSHRAAACRELAAKLDVTSVTF